jgi:hypothetical protein
MVSFLAPSGTIARPWQNGDVSCTITLMVEKNVNKGVFPRNGYRNIEWDVGTS